MSSGWGASGVGAGPAGPGLLPSHGVTIPAHRHRQADEIIVVHRGSGVARVGVFSAPGFEAYLRDMSVPEGETVTPLTGRRWWRSASGTGDTRCSSSGPRAAACHPFNQPFMVD